MTALCSGGTTLYAATHGGTVWRLNVGAAAWATTTDQLLPGKVTTMAVHGGTLYASDDSPDVYRLSGSTWEPVGNPLSATVNALTEHDGTLYAATDYLGVFVSGDGGTWASAGLENKSVKVLYSDGTTLYAGTEGSGVFRMQPAPKVDPITAPDAVTIGDTLKLTTPTVHANGGTILEQG